MTQKVPSPDHSILIADDNDDIFFLRRTLTRLGFEQHTWSVGDGEQAIAFLSRKLEKNGPLPALILLDWRMPKLGGPGVLRWAKAAGLLERTVVAVYTSSGLSEDVVTAYQEGAHTFIRKYASAEVLEELVQAAMRRRRSAWHRDGALPGIPRPAPKTGDLVR